MSGRYLYKPAETTCDALPEADAPGSVWKCDCGQNWYTDVDKNEPYWRRISLTETRKYLQQVALEKTRNEL